VQNPEIVSEILLIQYVFEIAVERHGAHVAPRILEGAVRARAMSVGQNGDDEFFDLVGRVCTVRTPFVA
jgi:hypothetical protein